MKQLFSFILLLAFVHANAQSKTFSVFFESGKIEPSVAQTAQLNVWLDSLSGPGNFRIDEIDLIGHCDSVGALEANKILSGKRANGVLTLLEERNLKTKILTNAMGEENPGYSNSIPSGRSKNRRVDVVVRGQQIMPINERLVKDQKIAEKSLPKSKDPKCEKDTILIFPQGMQITLKVCDYDKYFKDCPLKVTEYLTDESIQDAGLTTRSNKGEQLTTGGMFKIEWCSDKKFPVPLDVTLPISPCVDPQMQMMLWSLNGQTQTWESTRIEFIKDAINNRMRVALSNPGNYNCDGVISLPPTREKFIAKDGLKIKNLRVYYSCPNPSVYENQLSDRGAKRKAMMGLPQPTNEPKVYARAEDRDGNVYFMHCIPLNNLALRKWRPAFGPARKLTKSEEGFASNRNQLIARKYFLRKKDFDLVVPMGKGDEVVEQIR